MGLGRQAPAPGGRGRPSGWRSGGGGGGGGGSTAWVASLPSAEVYHHSSACFPPHPCSLLRSLARSLPHMFTSVVRSYTAMYGSCAEHVAVFVMVGFLKISGNTLLNETPSADEVALSRQQARAIGCPAAAFHET